MESSDQSPSFNRWSDICPSAVSPGCWNLSTFHCSPLRSPQYHDDAICILKRLLVAPVQEHIIWDRMHPSFYKPCADICKLMPIPLPFARLDELCRSHLAVGRLYCGLKLHQNVDLYIILYDINAPISYRWFIFLYVHHISSMCRLRGLFAYQHVSTMLSGHLLDSLNP